MTISKQLLDKLACPKCRGPVEVVAEGQGLACRSCALLFEVKDGIPAMLLEQAKSLSGASPS